MYLLILFLPLISSISSGLFGRYLGSKGTSVLSSGILVITSLLSWIAFYEVGINGNIIHINLFEWIETGLFVVSFGLLYDSVTVIMLIVVTTISSLVHVYSTGYMGEDPHLPRFMSYLSLFTFFMLILVTSNNLLQLFIGWEGVGLCSYLLINFWFSRIQANKSAIKAMVVNRIGDVGIAISIYLVYDTFKSLDFDIMLASSYYITEPINFFNYDFNRLNLIGIFFLIGTAGKSAQMGLHTWLPDAMEGPTPVSALIHAATMVTAGVFLLIRCSNLLEFAPNALIVISIIGALTAFMAATIGVVQNDIKKVIAYSTCSQLGYMVFICGISNYSIGLFHLMNHAFFKALLFLSAGCIIHAISDEQDMRKLGGLIQSLPLTYSMMLIGSLALMGFPFLTGYYSKDAILELAYSRYTFSASFGHWLGSISAFFTAFYSFRLLYLTFLTEPNAPLSSYSLLPNISHNHLNSPNKELPLNMSLPLIILAFGSIFIGWLFKDMIIGPGSPFFKHSIGPISEISHFSLFEAEFLDSSIKLIPVVLSLLGALFGFIIYNSSLHTGQLTKSPLFKSIYTYLNSKWFFDYIFNSFLVKPIFSFGYHISYKLLDRGFLEYLGPTGISTFIKNCSIWISSLHSGYIYHYALIIFLSSTLFLTFSSYQFFNFYILFPFFLLFFFASSISNNSQ